MQTEDRISEKPSTWIEEVTTTGEELVGRVKALVAEGNVRRVSIKHDGKTLAEFPLTLGVVGTLLAPQVAALGAIVALVTDCTIAVERAGASSEEDDGAAGALPPPRA
jgi:hypothetical protein